MKRLLVLAAGPLQLPAIQTAKRMGLFVIALDGDPHAPGLALADSPYTVNILDPNACLEIARREKPDGVIHICSEVAMSALGAINRELGLHGPDPEVVVRATNKEHMRRAFEAGGAPSPRSLVARTRSEALDAARALGSPVIVKPARNSGSRGVQRIDDVSDEPVVAAAFGRAMLESRDPAVVIEQFVEGPEFSVEILVWDGQARVLAVTDKQTTGAPFFVETGHSQPSGLSAADREQVVGAALAGVRALGINWSAAHAEVKLSPKGPFLMEIGARLGGDFITTELVPRSTGVDMVEAAIQLALGQPPPLRPTHPPQGSAIRYFTPRPGRVIAVEGIDEARKAEGVRLVDVYVGVGDLIEEVTSSLARVGHLIAEGPDAPAAIANAERARDMVRIVTATHKHRNSLNQLMTSFDRLVRRLARALDVPAWVRWCILGAYSGMVAWMMLAPARVVAAVICLFPHFDKVLHFFAYGILVWIFRWSLAAHTSRVPRFLVVTAGAIGYGVLMECFQKVLASYERSFEWLDIASNSAGALCFWVISTRLARVAQAAAR